MASKDKLQQGLSKRNTSVPADDFIQSAHTTDRRRVLPEDRLTTTVIAPVNETLKRRVQTASFAYEISEAAVVRRALEEFLQIHKDEIDLAAVERLS